MFSSGNVLTPSYLDPTNEGDLADEGLEDNPSHTS